MIIPVLFALLAPLSYAFMNIIDKFFVTHKIKNEYSYISLVGIVDLTFGIIVALFLNWSQITAKTFWIASIPGIFFGIQALVYIGLMKKHDISNLIGFLYTYPLVMILLSFIFLNEKLSLMGYVSIMLIVIGAILLSIRARKITKYFGIISIFFLIVVVALTEFFAKVSTNNINEWNAASISAVFLGLTLLLPLFRKSTRKGFIENFSKLKYLYLLEIPAILGDFFVFFAMAGLGASIVASIGALQPLFVVFFERIVDSFKHKISKDHLLIPKLVPICLIVIGVILLYLIEVI